MKLNVKRSLIEIYLAEIIPFPRVSRDGDVVTMLVKKIILETIGTTLIVKVAGEVDGQDPQTRQVFVRVVDPNGDAEFYQELRVGIAHAGFGS